MEKSAVRKIGRVSRLGKISKRKCRGRSEDRNHLCLLAEFEKENPADYRVWQAYVKIKCQCICIKLCILYVFVDHSDYYFIVFPAALDDAAEIRPVKGGVRGHAIADCADDEQPDRVAL